MFVVASLSLILANGVKSCENNRLQINGDDDMKKLTVVMLAAMVALSACTQLSDEDRALLTSAKQQAAKAAEDAAAARADADKAAKAAQDASEKADRIFRQGHNK